MKKKCILGFNLFLLMLSFIILTACEGGGDGGTTALSRSDVVFAYGSDSNGTAILRMNDSSGTTTLVASAADIFLVLPAVSLNRKKLAYLNYNDENIIFYDSDSSSTTDITPSGFQYFGDLSIALSPDGSKLAYNDYNLENGNFNYHIWVISTGSGNPTPLQLTDCATGMDKYPAWSPDGKQIAFIHVDTTDYDATIYSVNADGTSSDPYGNELYSQKAISGDSLMELAWSPVNPNRMVCSSRISSSNVKFSIYMLNLSTKERIRLTDNTSLNEHNPNWSRDGNYIFYNQEDNIYYNSIDNAGNAGTQLTADGQSSFCGWTPSE